MLFALCRRISPAGLACGALTAFAVFHSITSVKGRYALLVCALSFVVFVAALSFYMLSFDQPAPVQPWTLSDELAGGASDRAGPSLREHFGRLRGVRERASQKQVAGQQPEPRRREPAGLWRERLGQLAERADEAAVRFRSNALDPATARFAAGVADMQSGRQDEAIAVFDGVLARRPEDTAALSAKASSLVAIGRFEEAASAYAKLLALAPQDATVRYNYGVVLYRLSRFSEAAERFREVAAMEPNHAKCQYNLATLAQRAGRLGEARAAWQAFTRLEPGVASGWFNLGVVWMDFDRPMEAAYCFGQVVAIDANDAAGWLNLGLAYAAADHLEAALEAVKRADAASPCDGAIMSSLAELQTALAEAERVGGGQDFQRTAESEDQSARVAEGGEALEQGGH
jgi:tetratricopeptide (TPR) repeat protein